jgi:hypothetical protein
LNSTNIRFFFVFFSPFFCVHLYKQHQKSIQNYKLKKKYVSSFEILNLFVALYLTYLQNEKKKINNIKKKYINTHKNPKNKKKPNKTTDKH